MTYTISDLEATGANWYKTYKVAPSRDDRGPAALAARAIVAAIAFVDKPLTPVFTEVTPGNGYTYRTVLAQVPGVAEGTFGGNLVVALTEWHRSLCLNLGGLHTPDYLDEKLELGAEHSVPLAIFLSAFDIKVMELTGG